MNRKAHYPYGYFGSFMTKTKEYNNFAVQNAGMCCLYIK